MTAPPPIPVQAVARIRHRRLGVVGGGFLIGPDVIATCAHVVADAVGVDPYAVDAPTATVLVDFPLAGEGAVQPVPLDAVVTRWSPILEDGSGDVALLRLRGPAPARMPPVRRIDRLWDHDFRVLGFPEGMPGGVWASGRIRGEQGTRWFQLQTGCGGQRIEAGFSGAPVFDTGSAAVVGMTVAAHRGAATAAYLIPVDHIFQLDHELLPCPYPGALPFDAEHAAYFHGRDDDIELLAGAVARLPVVAVAGPSGVGKSSLLRAGLLPRLRAAGTAFIEFHPDLSPGSGEALASAVAGAAPGTVLVLDQFEELAALAPDAASGLLHEVLAHTGSGRIRAVLTVRWAALDRLAPRLVGSLDDAIVPVRPLDRTALRAAIVRPAEQTPGLSFEDGLVDRILDDAGAEPGQLPLVSALLADLWEHREGGRLTLRGYLESGGVAGALAQHADRVVGAAGDGADERTLRRLFTALAEPDRDQRFVRRAVPLRELPPEQRALAERLAARRLLVIAGDRVELAHQALIEHWPRLRDWLSTDREFLTWLAGLQQRRTRWETAGRDDDALLRGALLGAAMEWLASRAEDLPSIDQAYINRGAARERRRARRRRAITAVLTVLLLAVGTLSVLAVHRRGVVAAQLATASAGTLGREALARASADPALSAQLALAAWRADPKNLSARDALARAYAGLRTVRTELAGLSTEPIESMQVRGDTAVLAAKPHLVTVTGLSGPAPQRREFADLPASAAFATLSPDGRWLAYALTDRPVIQLRDLSGRSPTRELAGAPGTRIVLPAFSPQGDRLMWFTVSPAQVVELQVWDLRRNAEIPNRLGALAGDVSSGWLTDDPHVVLLRYGTFGKHGTRLVVTSLADGAEVTTLPPDTAVTPGGDAVVSIEQDPEFKTPPVVVVTPTANAGPPRRIVAVAEGAPPWERLSADGGWLIDSADVPATADYRELRLTNLSSGQVRQATIPSIPEQDSSTDSDTRLTPATSLGVVTSAGQTWLLLAEGTSLLRLTTEAVPATDGPPSRFTVGVGERSVLTEYETGMAVWDPVTGQRLGALTGLDPRRPDSMLDGDSLWIMNPLSNSWEIDHYQLPTLRRLATFQVPDRTPEGVLPDRSLGRIDLTPDGDRVVISNGGWLSCYDGATGRPIGDPVRFAGTPREAEYSTWFARVWARPDHPGQVAVKLSDGRTQLWQMPAGKLIRTFQTSNDVELAFDRSGTLMALPNRDQAIEVWDVDKGTLVGPPIAGPDQRTSILGFGSEGYLVATVTGRDGLGPPRVVSIEIATGQRTGAMALDDEVGMFDGDRQLVGLRVGATSGAELRFLPVLRVAPSGWRDALCAVVGRPFTPAERALLPPGSDPAPPCS